MTLFFLVVGMEIRREIHEGALSKPDQAALPLIAAIGGVIVPAIIYPSLNSDPDRSQGWAVPTATDIAFAVGILALLGRSIPVNVRVFLLALAIIDDIIAVLIIAVFYTTEISSAVSLSPHSVSLAVFAFQRMGIGSALAYVVPGSRVWTGFLIAGIHPTLAGVALGLITPARPIPLREHPLEIVSRVLKQLQSSDAVEKKDVQNTTATDAIFAWPIANYWAAGVAGADGDAPLGRLRHHADLRPGERRRRLDGDRFLHLRRLRDAGHRMALVVGAAGHRRRHLDCGAAWLGSARI